MFEDIQGEKKTDRNNTKYRKYREIIHKVSINKMNLHLLFGYLSILIGFTLLGRCAVKVHMAIPDCNKR